MTRADIYHLIDAERARQSEYWSAPHAWGKGDCSSTEVAPIVKVAVLAEECGEVARAVLDHLADSGGRHLREELVQVAAVCVAWLETFEAIHYGGPVAVGRNPRRCVMSNHDPLCASAEAWAENGEDPADCPECDLIAKVRADEQNRSARLDVVGETVMAAIINTRRDTLQALRKKVDALRPPTGGEYASGWIDACDAMRAQITGRW